MFLFFKKNTNLPMIGTRIKEARELAKLSQRSIADKLGMDPSQFSKIEKGKVMPTLLQLADISKIVMKSIDWIVTGTAWLQEKLPNDNFKEQYELAKQNIELLRTIQELKDRIHVLELANTNLHNKRSSEETPYPMVAEPKQELTTKGK